MKCEICGEELPEDSVYCQYCGSVIKTVGEHLHNQPIIEEQNLNEKRLLEVDENDGQNKQDNIVYAVELKKKRTQHEMDLKETTHGNKVNDGKPEDKYRKKVYRKKELEVLFKSKKTVRAILLAFLCIILVGGNVSQYLYFENEIKEREESIEAYKRIVSTKETWISMLDDRIAELADKADYFDSISGFLKSGNLGYAAYNFKSSESIIVLSKNTLNRKFTLTAYWSYGGTVDLSYSSWSVASVSFDKDTWSQSTTMTIDPRNEGATTVTFSNSADSNIFSILIIVTE